MSKKETFLRGIEYLLESAKARGSSQGVKIYEVVLNQIQNSESGAELDDILCKFNKTTAGIEAHGSFTTAEYRVVSDLRKL